MELQCRTDEEALHAVLKRDVTVDSWLILRGSAAIGAFKMQNDRGIPVVLTERQGKLGVLVEKSGHSVVLHYLGCRICHSPHNQARSPQ